MGCFQVIVDGLAGGLHEINVAATNGILNLNVDFTVCKALLHKGARLQAQLG